jgi:hypothetical protein
MTMTRRCYDCGANGDEAAFTGSRKPARQRDRCADCAADPRGDGFRERVLERQAQLAASREAWRQHTQQPINTTPLFAGLRPGGDNTERAAPGVAAAGEN